MIALKVEGLNKNYDAFQLRDVSFELQQGYIMGFIGSNGAGKTTTLKSILNMIHTDGGDISIFGKGFIDHEMALKQDIGYAFGGVDFYTKSKISLVTRVISRFYKNWHQATYLHYLNRFNIDEGKKISELSEGMKIKYALTLALSHGAKLFILDEPTSGLDPVARDNLLELFQELVEDGEKSILFSTHITSDLEKCADYITYINNGKIVGSDTYDGFIAAYDLVKGKLEDLGRIKKQLIAYKENAFGFTGLAVKGIFGSSEDFSVGKPSLEEIMIYIAKKEEDNERLIV